MSGTAVGDERLVRSNPPKLQALCQTKASRENPRFSTQRVVPGWQGRKLHGTYPMLAENVGNPLFEFPVCHRAWDFGLLGAASLHFRTAGAATLAAAPLLRRYALLLMPGVGLVDPVAAAGVQAAGRRRGGQTVAVPGVAELLLQSRGQRVHRLAGRPPQHVRVQGRAGFCTQPRLTRR